MKLSCGRKVLYGVRYSYYLHLLLGYLYKRFSLYYVINTKNYSRNQLLISINSICWATALLLLLSPLTRTLALANLYERDYITYSIRLKFFYEWPCFCIIGPPVTYSLTKLDSMNTSAEISKTLLPFK